MNDPSVKCSDGRSHYQVVSPLMTEYRSNGPPESGRCWGVFLAKNAREARHAAARDPEFAAWVAAARGDGIPPFKGLTVTLARCEHTSCWGCNATASPTGCPKCDVQSRDRQAVRDYLEGRRDGRQNSVNLTLEEK